MKSEPDSKVYKKDKAAAESSLDKKKKMAGKMRDIRYYKKNVYGNEHNYLHDSDIAHAHHQLTGQTTLRHPHIQAYEALGHKVLHIPKN